MISMYLYPATLLNSLISSSNFLIVSSGFSTHNIMQSAKIEIFTSSFQICIPFISFSSLIAVPRTSKAMLNSSNESAHPVLFFILEGSLCCSPLRVMLFVDFLMMGILTGVK